MLSRSNSLSCFRVQYARCISATGSQILELSWGKVFLGNWLKASHLRSAAPSHIFKKWEQHHDDDGVYCICFHNWHESSGKIYAIGSVSSLSWMPVHTWMPICCARIYYALCIFREHSACLAYLHKEQQHNIDYKRTISSVLRPEA